MCFLLSISMSLFFSNMQSKIEAHIYIGKQMNTYVLHITYFFKYKTNVEACNIYKENKQYSVIQIMYYFLSI